MNELSKTLGFLAVAAVVFLGAWAGKPPSEIAQAEFFDADLFPDFKDPLKAASLDIIQYEEETSTMRLFKVAKSNGVYSLPSHENYPADADRQLARVADGIINFRALNVVAKETSAHETFGVIDPDPTKLTSGAVGVGMRVTVSDEQGKKLADLIIGKSDPQHPNVRFIRLPNQQSVYAVEMDTQGLSTKFEDWIEKDLLKLNAFDVKRIQIRDYSVNEAEETLDFRANYTLAYDDSAQENKWKVEELSEFNGDAGEFQPVELAVGEELNVQNLDELRNALDTLMIVDVRRKPEGLSADLAVSEEFTGNREAKTSLMTRGFYLAKSGDRHELVSNEGEVRCGMKDGVEYVLRFGEIAGPGAAVPQAEAEGDKESGEAKSTGLNRFIMVTARFNPDLIPPPQLKPLPGEEGPEEKKSEAEKDAEEKPSEENKKASAAEVDPDELAKEKGKIERDNLRIQTAYDKLLKDGQTKVDDLNRRFAGWYYVISDATYQKIHLGRDQIIARKESPNSVKEFDDLKKSLPAPEGNEKANQQEPPAEPEEEGAKKEEKEPAAEKKESDPAEDKSEPEAKKAEEKPAEK